ncbi:MAG: hypothetical protein EG828_10965 [Deltaproteobacteria bacterium]|nr:hypothetical protein [Deltaproteobacteria bacterium]
MFRTTLQSHVKTTTLALCALLLVCSCASLPPVFADKDLLSFLTPGMSQEAILLKLGEPSASFESGRVLTYRIGEDEEKGYFLLDRQVRWENTKYSLVLVFDEKKLLTKHSLVQVR